MGLHVEIEFDAHIEPVRRQVERQGQSPRAKQSIEVLEHLRLEAPGQTREIALLVPSVDPSSTTYSLRDATSALFNCRAFKQATVVSTRLWQAMMTATEDSDASVTSHPQTSLPQRVAQRQQPTLAV